MFNSPKERRASYYGNLLSAVPYAKEMRLFGLVEHFLRLFRLTSIEIQTSQRVQQARELRWQVGLAVLASVVAGGAFVVVILEALQGKISLGDVLLYTSAVTSIQAASGLFGVERKRECAFLHPFHELDGAPRTPRYQQFCTPGTAAW
jgi:ATP-binding cassette subfamily B protein